MSPCTYGHLIFDKGGKKIQWRKNNLEGTNSRITEAEDRIREVEDRMVEINETQRKKEK